MRVPARIRPLVPAIAGGIIISLVAFFFLAIEAHTWNAPATNGVVPQIFEVNQMRQTAPVPLNGRRTQAADTSAIAGAPTQLMPLTKLATQDRTHVRPLDANPGRLPVARPLARSSQLIRTASINLEVQNIDRAIHATSAIVDGELGDIINLDYRASAQSSAVQTASMEVRVPQYRFESTLDELGALGKVTTRSVSAQDVADQIVDAQARLRNLRHTESDMLKIMDRYGDIEQVLRVTQELSNVREQIEMLDAQLKGMQYQVAYSTITINFSTPLPAVRPPSGTTTLGNAWHAAIAALQGLTLTIASAGLWLIAFSPYLLIVALVAIFATRRVRMRSAAG